ncbi:hypothetical protein SDC9_208418 [bioreactor metagenome]|uniref:Uncharacterized protein n=1 Tax=bioreactor metagenome TaxID=1076179 RepID=A0A645JBI0_9ZZZZ
MQGPEPFHHVGGVDPQEGAQLDGEADFIRILADILQHAGFVVPHMLRVAHAGVPLEAG